MPSAAIIVPAYNAEKHLERVIERIPQKAWNSIVVLCFVNDGSTDQTQTIIEKLLRQHTVARSVGFSKNGGYGKAVRTGLEAIQNEPIDYAVCLHADGQYPPEQIPEFLAVAEAQQYDILQGSRVASGTALAGGMPRYKYIAGKVLTIMENKVFGLSMTDYHSGYLCYSKKALNSIPFERLSSSFDFDLEVIATARKYKLKIGEIPIPTRYADEKSHLNPLGYGLRVLAVMAKYVLGKYAKN